MITQKRTNENERNRAKNRLENSGNKDSVMTSQRCCRKHQQTKHKYRTKAKEKQFDPEFKTFDGHMRQKADDAPNKHEP